MGDDDMDEDEVRETPFWSRCIATKNDRFTKTGSGQTYKKRCGFCRKRAPNAWLICSRSSMSSNSSRNGSMMT